jgi:hypothetical protein
VDVPVAAATEPQEVAGFVAPGEADDVMSF